MTDMIEDSRVSAARAWLNEASPATPDAVATEQIIIGLINAYEARLRVNMGLLAENAELKRDKKRNEQH